MSHNLCPKFEKAMGLLGQRWTGLIIFQLLQGPQRFCILESSMPISARVLSERLKDLEHEGIVKRNVYPETPVRIEYSLTDKGKALQPLMSEIQRWAEEWQELDTDHSC
ncbi:winged helix-turn-helix transcriptional regulator [Lederbergia galactosidilytica]|uniref:HxlR family transcriptional regulator n=1 Tax=Lederbergia galactosidilytica TaxID=217031 RepID=A0A0Q9XQZ3_9BACI|nr:winged helix-turn-helix transcriptional regulator [Lederbergia galactosidilytica]KRG10700.1 HxlR family transcriptional regulator [Lederbergia galactosidilytica]KRG13793.1 HxlR family transcriptional regulator [Virgibacillus soli]MBP1916975.1 DNA-binding HxlR family transcriptional regulator [Lederbergia galactosidilytica]OAK67449.1 HxlR family transcriptional regulator [Lederbergia galactosidilytica]